MKKLDLTKSLVALALVLTYGTANAQLDSCSVFLKGRYVEVGIAPSGSFGAPHMPAGYHGNSPSAGAVNPCYTFSGGTGLGFIVDPDMDGWSVGTPPFYGDYFLPGSPFEGWSIQMGGTQFQAYNTTPGTGFTGTLTGTNTSYTTSGSNVIGTWVGSNDSVEIKQITTLDTNSLFFTVKIVLTNLASTAKDNIYYLRTLDPDNDQRQSGGGFTTRNVVEYQSTDTTVVSATGIGTGHSASYMAMGTTDTNSTCLVYNSWPISSTIDLATVYDGSMSGGYFTAGYTNTADVAIGLAFHVAHLAPVDSASFMVHRVTSGTDLHPANSANFTYFYAFSPAARDSAIAFTRAASPSLGTKSLTSSNDVKVYPNPSNNYINVSGLNINDQISIVDMTGRIALSERIGANGTNAFNIASIPVGPYIVIVKSEDGNVKSRVRFQKQ